MMKIPLDIIVKINSLFPSVSDRNEVMSLLSPIWSASLGVGADQLVRSILIISQDNILIIKEIIDSNFRGDPRDVIMEAEAQVSYPNHYGNVPFSNVDDYLSIRVNDREDFIMFLELLRADLEINKSKWANNRLDYFLDALQSYTADIDGYYKNIGSDINADKASWALFADILRGAIVYE